MNLTKKRKETSYYTVFDAKTGSTCTNFKFNTYEEAHDYLNDLLVYFKVKKDMGKEEEEVVPEVFFVEEYIYLDDEYNAEKVEILAQKVTE